MDNIGRYEIISELGRGGMASVYQATDPRFERKVAIKVLPKAFLHDPQFRIRFEREAKMIAALEHSAIVPVYDFGEQDDQPYIVMRLMSGGSLADKLKDDKLSIEEAAQIVRRVASALSAAHQRGIVHRDLKPGNILFDQYNNAFLSDFGIARISESSAALTGSNILGTPAYMSPEQVQGDRDIDGRSDIYALGVIFYQMLVGNTPYQATTPVKVMMMHLLEPVPNLISALPDVTPAVEAWFEKALAKDPNDRFATAKEMSLALDAAIQDDDPLPDTLVTKPDVVALDQTIATGTPTFTVTPSAGSAPASTSFTAAKQVAQQVEQPPRSRFLPFAIGGLVIFSVAAIGLIAVVLLGFRGSGPFAMLAPVSPTPDVLLVSNSPTDTNELVPTTDTTIPLIVNTATQQLPSETPEPVVVILEATETQTATEAPPTITLEPTSTPTLDALVMGGADKIAFVDQDEIWVMSVDGSDLKQLTVDGAEKIRLRWTPDGSAVTYISGKCVWAVDYQDGAPEPIACFESAKYVDDFSISSDGTRVAISLNLELFVVPYDRARLAQINSRSELIEMSECEVLAPLTTNTGASVAVTQVKWSKDDTQMAIKVLAPEGGIQVDLIRFADISNCQNTDLLDEFPATRFDIEGYRKTPYIQNFGYDGIYLFAMNSYERNDGYGHLYLYNTNVYRAESKVNPINGTCCYRDPGFSPDGSYLIFAYQPFEIGAKTQLYLALVASLGTGGNFEPIPLPDTFFSDPKVKPQPAFRPIPSQ
jgi:serine/threonine protein kinase